MNHKMKDEFIRTIREYERIILKISHLYAKTRDERCDLYQEIVLQLWLAYESFRGEAKISTWIYRVALNTAIGQLRQSKRKLNTLTLCADDYQIPDLENQQTPEQLRQLYHAIGQLPALDKAIIVLYLDANAYDEIAFITGLTPTNVSTRVLRIKDRLKELIHQQQ